MLMTNSEKQGCDVDLGGEQGKRTKERVGVATKSNDPFQLGAYSNKILTRKGRFHRGRPGREDWVQVALRYRFYRLYFLVDALT